MLFPGQDYHIYNHANAWENFFREKRNYQFFLNKFAYYISPIADIFAYCLMPNHFHIQLRIKPETILQELNGKNNTAKFEKIEDFITQQFSNFFNSYTKSYNKVYNRKGALFLHGFKNNPIESDRQFIQTLLYIHLNPVKHKFTKDYLEWEWSSFKKHYSEEKPVWLNTSGLQKFFKDKEAYLRVHKERSDILLNLNLDLEGLTNDFLNIYI
jgi:putative transposase